MEMLWKDEVVWKLLENFKGGKVVEIFNGKYNQGTMDALVVITVRNHSSLLGNQIILIGWVHESVGKKKIGKG